MNVSLCRLNVSYPEHVTKGFWDATRDGQGRMELQHVDRLQSRAGGKDGYGDYDMERYGMLGMA